MQWTSGSGGMEAASLKETLSVLVQALGMELIELDIFRGKAKVQIRAVVYKTGSLGTDDCARAYHAVLPRLELAFPGHELSVEVSTPGIKRVAKDGEELSHYRGRGLRVWRTDIQDWSAGILEAADGQGIQLKEKGEIIRLDYSLIAKAMLDPSQEENFGH